MTAMKTTYGSDSSIPIGWRPRSLTRQEDPGSPDRLLAGRASRTAVSAVPVTRVGGVCAVVTTVASGACGQFVDRGRRVGEGLGVSTYLPMVVQTFRERQAKEKPAVTAPAQAGGATAARGAARRL